MGHLASSSSFRATRTSVTRGADEEPISFGDSRIMFIRLTFANANDDFKQKARR